MGIEHGRGEQMKTYTPAWWHSEDEVQALARDLVEVGELDDARSVLDFFEKPFKWSVEWLFWSEHERSDDADVWGRFDDWKKEQQR